jgi:hypothetical protein
LRWVGWLNANLTQQAGDARGAVAGEQSSNHGT